jgi:hypothetical protein
VELYNHIEAAEVEKVKEQVATKRTWHETQMQASQTTPKYLTAPVTCAQIRAKAKVSNRFPALLSQKSDDN